MHPGKSALLGLRSLKVLEGIGLTIVALATVVAAGQEVARMLAVLYVTLGDLLLLFIYLEIFAMVGLYVESGKLPVRMPLYIGIVALARYLILDIKEMDNWRIIAVASAVLILATTVLVVRFGRARFLDSETRRGDWLGKSPDTSEE